MLLFWVSTDSYRVIVQRVLKFVEKWKGTAIVLVNKLTKEVKGNGLLYDETVHFPYVNLLNKRYGKLYKSDKNIYYTQKNGRITNYVVDKFCYFK